MKKTVRDTAKQTAAATTITGLQVNWLDLAFGVVEPPVFSWRMESEARGAAQSAYRILVAKDSAFKKIVWDTDFVKSPVSAAVRYEGKALTSNDRYWWRVEVKTKKGELCSSTPSFFDTGLIKSKLWDDAAWIMPPPKAKNAHPAMALRKCLKNKKPLKSAKWFVSGLGVFEAYVNGRRVSNLDQNGNELFDELKPGFTDARKARQYFSYDVTHLFNGKRGAQNTLSAVVTSGWWSDNITGYIGKNNAFRGLLFITYSDNSTVMVPTDTSWDAAFDGPIVNADIYLGVDIDARISSDWMTGAPLGPKWTKAVENTEFSGRMDSLQGPPVRVRRDLELAPVSIKILDAEHFDGVEEECYGKVRTLREYRVGDEIQLKPGELLLADFAQNCVGHERICLSGPRGATLLVRHSEFLNDGAGLKSRGNDGPEGMPYYRNLRGIRASTKYILSGKGEECCCPIFSFGGYQYLAVSASKPVTIRSLAAEIVNSVPEGADTAFLETSDALVNRLVKNCRWGHYGNYLSVPTDCPQRDERLGWTADTQVFSAAAAYDGVSYGFLSKFMRDMRDAQGEEGGFPGVAPYAKYGNERCKVGWSDAAVIVPYNMWKAYGDTTIIRENWQALCRYMELLSVVDGPLPCWGDWLAYERNDYDLQRYVCAVYHIWDCMMMQEMARAIGDSESEGKFSYQEKKARELIRNEFLEKDGTVKALYRCQTAYLFALMLKLNTTPEAREATHKALVENIHAHGDRLQTGFLGTAVILNVLSDIGETELAYKLLLQRNEPSWLYSVLQGATTMWERWNSYTKEKGFGDAGMNSFNHYAYGAVLEWMFAYMAGIRYDAEKPGYGRVVLAPQPNPLMGEIKASYRTPYGLVESAWRYKGKAWQWTAVLPANTTAEVRVPCRKGRRLLVNGKAADKLTLAKDGIVLRQKDTQAYSFEAVAGALRFEL